MYDPYTPTPPSSRPPKILRFGGIKIAGITSSPPPTLDVLVGNCETPKYRRSLIRRSPRGGRGHVPAVTQESQVYRIP
ncbi:uncharacterized protein DS421_4g120190 [Arachis hypogaea]|nr:uncharacterized protein DS421_4g120190 [Arachis hypogaea]